MGALPYAVHRSVFVVDVEKFGDQSRTNAHQLAVRDGLFRSLRWSFARSGVPWERCRCEDRGDGALVLVPPDVPKNLLGGPLPLALVAALEKHNATGEQEAHIRLRAVLHAGEIHFDDYGAAGTAINLAFRLLESAALRSVLAESSDVLALMASEWFFQEVIRHEPVCNPAAFRRVPVSVKETETTAWACLPRPADRGPDVPPPALAWRDPAMASDGGPVVVGTIPQRPAACQSRAGLVEQVTGQDAGVSVVFALTGARGVGKTQLAAAVARARLAERWRLVAWVDADDRRLMLAGLHRVACALGLAGPDTPPQDSAAAVRHHLEASGQRCLLVFDNAVDADALLPFLPAAGRSQVVVTSTRRALGNLGKAVAVDLFTADEAVTYLTERTGLADADGARAVADELGQLPLALAQAAAVIDGQRLDYGTYLRRLLAMTVAEYLPTAPGDPYPHSAAQAVLLSAAGITDKPGQCRALLNLIAVLSPTGVPRPYLHQAGKLGLLRPSRSGKRGMTISPAAVDALLGRLVDASLITISVGDGVVTAHRLVMRVMREQLAHDHHLNSVAAAAAALLADLLVPSERAWTQPRAVDELIKQITALNDHLPAGTWTTVSDRHLAEAVLALRGRALWYLNDALTLPSHTITFGNALVADSTRILGPDHPDTLTARNHLAWAYETAGDLDEAIRRYEHTAADRTRVLGPDHPDTLTSRHNLTWAYFSTGRLAEAISLGEGVFTDRERVQGSDHPAAIGTRAVLSSAYARAGRHDDAVSLGEQYLRKSQRVLGPDHPDTLAARNNLAYVYAAAGRYEEAITLHEHVLSDRQRVLGHCHPDTFASHHNLARTYEMAGRRAEAIRRYQEILADSTRMLGSDHPITRTVAQSLAVHSPPASDDDRYIRRRRRPSEP